MRLWGRGTFEKAIVCEWDRGLAQIDSDLRRDYVRTSFGGQFGTLDGKFGNFFPDQFN